MPQPELAAEITRVLNHHSLLENVTPLRFVSDAPPPERSHEESSAK